MPENTSRSFVVRIWIEPREIANGSFEWRGMIQDVITNDRKYFKKFDEMIAFVILQISQDTPDTKGFEQ
jgi:hypothetical protein